MTKRAINKDIIEDLYTEALVLADDARAAFDLQFDESKTSANDLTQVALSVEGLRTTTRVMHVLAWLLNQRAYLAGELSEAQLQRYGALPAERESDADNVARLEPETRELIRESERLHERIARLDRSLRTPANDSAPVQSLQGRIEQAFAAR